MCCWSNHSFEVHSQNRLCFSIKSLYKNLDLDAYYSDYTSNKMKLYAVFAISWKENAKCPFAEN